jgi:putative ABC transport system permease protein
MLVNETFASRYLTGDPLNAILRVPFHPMGDLFTPHFLWRVLGVVADVNNRAAGEPVLPEVFATFDQIDGGPDGANWVAVRTTGDPAAIAADLRAIAGRAGADAVVEQVMTMETRLMRSLARPRLYAILLGGFATFALLIAVIGLFGGLSYGVAQRTRELGVRAALGATSRNIMALVMKPATIDAITALRR